MTVTWLPGDKITAAKLNAMQADWISAIEGDYTSYKYVWGRDYNGAIASGAWLIAVTNTGTVILSDVDTSTNIYKRTYAGVESSAANYLLPGVVAGTGYTTGVSVLATYMAFQNNASNNTTFHVYKAGSLLQAIDTSDDDANCDEINIVGFSPNGRYIAVLGEPVGEGNNYYVMLYEADV